MGLRLLAHYFDRNEALIVSGVLDAAGVTNFLHNSAQISIYPFHEIAYGGYRIVVCEEELLDALNVIDEARRKRSFEGERLVQRAYIVPSLVLLALFGIVLPFRTSKWHAPIDPRDEAIRKLQ